MGRVRVTVSWALAVHAGSAMVRRRVKKRTLREKG
jgi:hypothetical protein